MPALPPTNLSTLIHLLRLKRIESSIQNTIYRVDRLIPSQELFEHTNSFLEMLEAWKACIPCHANDQDNPDRQIYLSYDSYVRLYPFPIDHQPLYKAYPRQGLTLNL